MSKKKQHKLGKHTGYGLIGGQYHIAPMYVEMFENLRHKYKSVDDVLGAVTEHCRKDYEVLEQENKRIWDALRDDLGVDFASGEWRFSNGVVVPVPKKEDK